MLCGLADGLAALLDAGVEAKRIILVGGAAGNKAVQEIAAEVFGLDILIPKPGEYVAFGAAAQAAGVILQTPPSWKLDGLVTVPAKDSSIALDQYRAVLAKTDFS
jgi:xylulokinase